MTQRTVASTIGIRREGRLPSQQMGLFTSRLGAGTPDWPDLPKDAREALVRLMTRLILEHARATAASTTVEAGHDR